MQIGAESAKYYDKGSDELAKETPLTIQKLEKRRNLTPDSKRLVIVLVGLPGRGKSFVARKLSTFFTWRGTEAKIFNVGRYRREAVSETSPPEGGKHSKKGSCDASFFDSANKQAAAMRQAVAELALKDMLEWLDQDLEGESGCTQVSAWSSSTSDTVMPTKDRIAIFDATNSTNARRTWVLEQCTCPSRRKDKPTGVVFVESICDDQELLEENFRFKILNSPDFQGMSTDEAIADLKTRVEKYEEMYETINDDNLSYIKIFNLSSKLMVNQMYGRMAKTMVPALIAWNIGTRPVFLCRAGSCPDGKDEEAYQTGRKLVAGKKLGPKGIQFRNNLAAFIRSEGIDFVTERDSVSSLSSPKTSGTSISGISGKIAGDTGANGEELPFPLIVMSSTMPRSVQTVNWDHLPFPVEQMSSLNPLDKGDFGGMELEDIRKENPDWYAQLEQDPFHTRFPGGESYNDLIRRLEPVVIDIEQQVAPVVVVSHVSIIQVLIAYFRHTPVEKCTSIEVPMHTVMKFKPARGGGWSEQSFPLETRDENGDFTPLLSPGHDSCVSVLSELSEECRHPPIWGDPVSSK